MKLPEYISKGLLKAKGIHVPRSILLRRIQDLESNSQDITGMLPVVVKAQNLVGGRGKKGGVRICETWAKCFEVVKDLFTKGFDKNVVDEILVEEKIPKRSQEYYLSLSLDRNKKKFCLAASREGGVDIEEADEGKIRYYTINPFIGLQDFTILNAANCLDPSNAGFQRPFVSFVRSLYELSSEIGAILVEINPLVVEKNSGDLVALDAKIILDENFQVTNPNLEQIISGQNKHGEMSKFSQLGFSCVEMEGNIAVISNGAGEGMAIIDQIASMGGKVGWWVDLAGGALSGEDDSIKKLFREMLRKCPVVFLFSAFFQIGDCTLYAQILKELIAEDKEAVRNTRLLARLNGRNSSEAAALLKDTDVFVTTSAEEACRMAIQFSKANKPILNFASPGE